MDASKLLIYENRKLDSTKAWILFLFLGWSYGLFGKMKLQILYYITLGGLGIWAIIRLFTFNKAIKKYNRKIADQIGLSDEEKRNLGLI